MEKISIHLQVTEAEQHCRDMANAAAKPGKAQAMNKMRHRTSLAILDSLHWLKDHEQFIRAAMAERRKQ